jgi:hypothetical protein
MKTTAQSREILHEESFEIKKVANLNFIIDFTTDNIHLQPDAYMLKVALNKYLQERKIVAQRYRESIIPDEKEYLQTIYRKYNKHIAKLLGIIDLDELE